MGDVDGSTGGEALNGAPRIRVRAGGGQATDPHTVAERQRTQRIAQKLKSLHELVPNATKVLSASKLGSVGSFGPLTPNVAAKASASLLQPGGSLSKEGGEFENNIVKFMERDMNGAMDYLQSKGLCLIPVAQVTTICNEGRNPGGLGSSRTPDSSDRRNTETTMSCSDVLGNKAIKKGKGLVPTDKLDAADSVKQDYGKGIGKVDFGCDLNTN